jgi:UDP-glucose 4-epimerase
LNCGYGKGFSVKEVAERFKKITKKNIKIQYKDRRLGDMEEIIADVIKLNSYLKWRPKFNDLDKIIVNCIEWEKKLKKIINY